MSGMHILLFIVSSMALTKKIRDLRISMKKGNSGNVKVDILFLVLIISLIIVVVILNETKN